MTRLPLVYHIGRLWSPATYVELFFSSLEGGAPFSWVAQAARAGISLIDKFPVEHTTDRLNIVYIPKHCLARLPIISTTLPSLSAKLPRRD